MIESKETPHQMTLHHLDDIARIVENRFLSYEWEPDKSQLNLNVNPEIAWDLMKLLRSQGYRVKGCVGTRFRKPVMVLSTSLNGRSGKSVAYARRAAELAAEFDLAPPQVLYKKRSVELSFYGGRELERTLQDMVESLDELGHALMRREPLGNEFIYTVVCD